MKITILYLIFSLLVISLFGGCAVKTAYLDHDGDMVPDYKDVCKYTPPGAKVDQYGCALDSDFDGVIDLYDRCPDTSASQLVDKNGCTIREF